MPSGEDALDDGRKPQIHEAKHDCHDGNKAQNRKRRFARFLERRPRNLTQFAARIFDILRQAGDGVGGLVGLGVGLRGFLYHGASHKIKNGRAGGIRTPNLRFWRPPL